MTVRRTVVTALAMGAVAAVMVAGAAPASAASLTGKYVWIPNVKSEYGTANMYWALGYTGSTLRGSAVWYAAGEHLWACDKYGDGLTVTAWVSYPDANTPTHHTQQVSDANGSADGCSDLNLSLPEQTPVKIRVCVSSMGCTAWYDGRA